MVSEQEIDPNGGADAGDDESWGDIAKMAGAAAATSFGSWIASLLVWGGIAVFGLWIFSSSRRGSTGDPTRLGWLGLAIFAVGAGGLVGFHSLRAVRVVMRGQVRFLDISPMRFFRSAVAVAAWAFGLYALLRAVIG